MSTMLNFTLLLLFPTIVFSYSSTRIYVCQDSSACASSEYEAHYFSCEGYQSCANSQIKSKSYISCDSKYSCLGADLTAADDVYCDGVYSCYDMQLEKAQNLWCANEYSCGSGVVEARGNIYCEGNYACSKGDFLLTQPKGSLVVLSGDYSGQLADFTFGDSSEDVQYMYVNGYNALYYSNLYSGTDNTVHYYFRGFHSAAYTGVYCESGATCTVNCFGYACLNTMMFCHEDATCNYACFNTKNLDYCAMESIIDFDITDDVKAQNRDRAPDDQHTDSSVTEQDHFNMKIPMSDTEYEIYSQVRDNKASAGKRKQRASAVINNNEDKSSASFQSSKSQKIIAGPAAQELGSFKISIRKHWVATIVIVGFLMVIAVAVGSCACWTRHEFYQKL